MITQAIGELKYHLSPPHMSGNEINYIIDAFQSNYIAPVGKNIDSFERSIRNFTGSAYSVATNSGTSAIHLGLIALGATQQDIVLCQSFTFAASANPILYQNSIPVFIESEHDTWNMDPESLEKAIKASISGDLEIKTSGDIPLKLPPRKPKAIVVVHLYGMPAKMEEILAISEKYDIPVIEDAAEALGSEYKGVPCGTLGELGVLSFNGNKIITTSGGGALLTKNQEHEILAKKLASQARENCLHYEHKHIGFNYRLSNVSAGIGIAQMEVIKARVGQRRKNFSLYQEFLANNEHVEFLKEPADYKSNRWLTTIILKDFENNEQVKDDLIRHLFSKGIETRPLWKPLHSQPVFSKYPYFGRERVSEDLFSRGICLPSGSSLNWEDIFFISNEIIDYLNQRK